MIADNHVGGSGHFRPAVRLTGSVAGATHTPAKSVQLGKIVLTVTKRNPGQFTLSGFYRLLPQLVGYCDPGGVGVSGDGDAARIGLLGHSNGETDRNISS
jgi:hypothetical protein